jgi:hypothetical protein
VLWLEIVCDNCAIGGHGLRDRLDRSAERELTDSAKSGGWLSKRASAGKPRQDLCPKCRGAFDCKHPVIRIYLNAKGDDVLRCVGCQAVIPFCASPAGGDRCQLPLGHEGKHKDKSGIAYAWEN